MKWLLKSFIICLLLASAAYAEEKTDGSKEVIKEVPKDEASGRRFSDLNPEFQRVRSFNIKNAMDGSVPMYLIDVRDEKDFHDCRIKGAINLRDEQITPRNLRKIFPNKKIQIIVYGEDREDKRSQSSVTALKTLGYKNIFLYENGWDEWEMREYPTDCK